MLIDKLFVICHADIMLSRLIIFGVFVAVVFGLYYFLTSTTPIATQPVPSPATQNLSTTYFGKFPCADCPGLDITITFNRSNPTATSGTYIEHDLYEQRNNNQPTTTVGQWMLSTGTPVDQNAQIYVLNPSGNGQPSYYQVTDEGNTLQLLDPDKKPIDSPFNSKLTKQP